MVQVQILSKILNTKDFSIVEKNLLGVEYFTGYEEEFKYIQEHYNKYGKVPDSITFLEKFPDFDIIDVKESNTYLVDKIKEE